MQKEQFVRDLNLAFALVEITKYNLLGQVGVLEGHGCLKVSGS